MACDHLTYCSYCSGLANALKKRALSAEARIEEAWKCLDALLLAVYQPDKSALSVAHAITHVKQALRD